MQSESKQLILLQRALNIISGSSIEPTIQILPLSSFSNNVYKINYQNDSYLLKIFRQYLVQFSNKQVENHVIMKLSELEKFPKVYKACEQLRFQEFIHGSNPNTNNVSTQQMLTMIDRLVDLVKIFSDDDLINGKQLKDHRKISRMFHIFQTINQQCMKNHPDAYQVCKQYTTALLHPSVRSHLQKIVPNVLVPTHNDCHFHNVLVTPQNQLYLIDYEFFGLNYRGFELGNFFNEFATDYQSFQIMQDLELSGPIKNLLIQRYYGQVDSSLSMEQCAKQVEIGRLLSHLFWFWIGVKQVRDPKITIDMQVYIKQRYEEFEKIYKRF